MNDLEDGREYPQQITLHWEGLLERKSWKPTPGYRLREITQNKSNIIHWGQMQEANAVPREEEEEVTEQLLCYLWKFCPEDVEVVMDPKTSMNQQCWTTAGN